MSSAGPGAPCAPPADFVATPPPVHDPHTPLVSHTEEVLIDRPLETTLAIVHATALQDAIDRSTSLPFVIGVHELQPAAFFEPGTQRFVCLSDGSTLREQILSRSDTAEHSEFSYVVWDYGAQAARPVRYGLGSFRYEAVNGATTRVIWTYSFALHGNRWPGSLGPVGRGLFRVAFLERDYASMMRNTLRQQKQRVETAPAG